MRAPFAITNTDAGVWADTAYRSRQNETFLKWHGFISHNHRRHPPSRPLPVHIRRGNARHSHDHAPVEHVFAVQKQAMGLTIRTIGLDRTRTKIGMALTSPSRSGASSSSGAALPPDQPTVGSVCRHLLNTGHAAAPTTSPAPESSPTRRKTADRSYPNLTMYG